MLKPLNACDFDKVYEIMEASFPHDERRSYAGQLALLDLDIYKIYVLYDGEDVKAFITTYNIGDYLFAEHFAVNEKYRNLGLGSEILKELLLFTNCRIILEVEPPSSEIAARRVGFYMRNGFSLNEYDYTQPSLGEGRAKIKLMLMTTGGKLSEDEFNDARALIYEKVYHTFV